MLAVGILLGALFVTPIVLFYLFFIRWLDRFEPEPWWLVMLAFVWGAVFATFAGGLTSGVAEDVVAGLLHIDVNSTKMQAVSATVLAPIFEEGSKGLGVALIALASALGLKELDGPLDGVIYGGVVGLGFTLTEDTLYIGHQFAESGMSGFVTLFFVRTLMLGLSHCTFTACTGLGFGVAVVARSWPTKIGAPIVGLGSAIVMHGVHNALPTFFENNGLTLMLGSSWIVDFAFFAIVWVLVVRDRAIVIRELLGEVGGLLQPRELVLVSSYVSLGWKNFGVLTSLGWRAFRERRKKQLLLVELAFVKSRRRRGEWGRALDQREASLRRDIELANRRGVWIGS